MLKPLPRDKMLRKDSRARPGLETCLRLGEGGGPVFYKLKVAITIDVRFTLP
jgi:hypothetical protein